MRKDGGLAVYYRKSAAIVRIVRFAVLLSFVIFSVYCIGFFSQNLTKDSVKSVINSIYRSFNDLTPSETEIKINSDDSASFLMMNNDMAVVTNSSAVIYAFSGDKMLEYDYTYSDAAAVTNGKELLVYDVAGKSLALYSNVAKLFSTELEYGVKNACINDMGYFAVVSSEKTYRSGVIVFGPGKNNKYEEKFRWMSPDKYVMSVALNSNASELTCAAVSNKNGSFVTELVVYDISTGERKYTSALDDTMVMKIGYTDNDKSIYALADGAFMCFDRSLNLMGEAEFNRNNARFFKETEDAFVVAQSNNLSGSSMTVHLYGYNGTSIYELKTDSAVIDADFRDSKLYVLYKDKLAVYRILLGEMEELAYLPLDLQFKAVRTDNYGRFILVGAKNAKRGSVDSLIAQNP